MNLGHALRVGMISFGKHEGRTLVGMGADACRLALKDADIHPSGVRAAFFASGLASSLFGEFTVVQIVEVVTKLRREDRAFGKMEGAKVGLAHCMGGDKDGDSKSCTVSIFSV